MNELALCNGRLKVRYPSEAKAERGLRDVRHARGHPKHNTPKVEKRAYLCKYCGGWHLTSKPDRNDPEDSRPS